MDITIIQAKEAFNAGKMVRILNYKKGKSKQFSKEITLKLYGGASFDDVVRFGCEDLGAPEELSFRIV